jgi:hypothetical protein
MEEQDESELVEAQQVETIIRRFDDQGQIVSKVVTVTTEYMAKVDIEHTGFYL